MQTLASFFTPCPRGLEHLLADELNSLGACDVTSMPGGVGFTGPFSLCYRVNLNSRIASRVLWRVARGPYRHEQDLYQAARAHPWPDFFSSRSTIKVKVSARRCTLKSLEFITLRIKDAICDRFMASSRARPSVNTTNPDLRIDVFLDEHTFTLYLDTSGAALFKRGYRQAGMEAPLRENLAAGLLRLSGWTPDQVLLDPMCGSGTILMEAVQIGCHIAPGTTRTFAFQNLAAFEAKVWRELREEARSRERPGTDLAIYGSDANPKALKTAHANLEAAGLTNVVRLKRANVLEITPPAPSGILLTNPPYGVRLGSDQNLSTFYPRWGDRLKQRFHGWQAYIFTADHRLSTLIGLAPTRRTPLFNGALECRLFAFKLVQGSGRRTLRRNASS